jgi:dGTPase
MIWEQLLSTSRHGQKNASSESSRSAFEQDYDRIIFSHPFRRLQDKTQVHPLPEHDFVHTRLTHSLEVSSVARSLGRKTGEVIVQRHNLSDRFSQFDIGAITAAAALAHDIGNPPFGHAGEDALGDFFSQTQYGKSFQEKVSNDEWSDLIKFEGNAQGFRLLNSTQFGLSLTYATLGAFTKYPCSSSIKDRNRKRKSQKKFGFYQSEKNIFSNIAENLGLAKINEEVWLRHPLAFLVEAADDICYSIIDLEDGCRLGLISFSDTVDLLAAILKDDFNQQKLDKISGQNQKLGVLRALVINKLVEQCAQVFLDHEQGILQGRFDQALTDNCIAKETLDVISASSVKKIYQARNVLEIEASGHVVLPGLLEEFGIASEYFFKSEDRKDIPRKYQNLCLLLPPEILEGIHSSNTNLYEVLRLVLDFISGLTDKHALSLFRKIKGISF